MNNDQFFNSLAVEARIADPGIARAVYFGLCRMILKNIIDKGSIDLPDWGIYRVGKKGSHAMRDVRTKELKMTRASYVTRFIPARKLRFYVDAKMSEIENLE